ncbi:MAG: hypothetical protein NTV19_15800 [Burkholderiales bacterium]|nr:hypothetical protein [Burkholderiales bacterium]
MRLGRAWGWMLALGWVLALAGPAGAQDIASRLAACGACHGAAGQSVLPGIPSGSWTG